MNLRNLNKVQDMANYTFLARGREGFKKARRVSVDARTRQEAEELAKQKVPCESLEFVSRTASDKGKLTPLHRQPKKDPEEDKTKGPGKYKITYTVYDEKDVVDGRTTTVQAESEDDAYAQAYQLYEDWRDNHDHTVHTHTTYLAQKISDSYKIKPFDFESYDMIDEKDIPKELEYRGNWVRWPENFDMTPLQEKYGFDIDDVYWDEANHTKEGYCNIYEFN